jgi:Zn2+/Cd2+-exporting ATPase
MGIKEGLAASRARAGISALVSVIPRTATLIEGESRRNVPVTALEVGQSVVQDVLAPFVANSTGRLRRF